MAMEGEEIGLVLVLAHAPDLRSRISACAATARPPPRLGVWEEEEGGEEYEEEGEESLVGINDALESLERQLTSLQIYSCSYQGEICLMDFKKENFNMVHLCESPVYSLCQAQNHARCLYFGDGNGDLTLFDERVGKVSTTWDVHNERINSIDFHPENMHMLATSSTDQTACIWDLRSMRTKEPGSLKVFKLDGPAQSAYFSPRGRMLAITSYSLDGTVQVYSMDDFEKSHAHNNQTGTWLSTFKVIWGWNDTDLYVGNMIKAVDIISVDVNDSGLSARNSACLWSEYMKSIPCQLSAHPYKVGHLACANSNGKVFLWTSA